MKYDIMLKKLVVTAALSTLAVPAMAEGFYVLGSVGQSYWDVDSLPSFSGVGAKSSNKKDDLAYKLQVGYQFNPYLAIEGGYVDLGKTTYSTSQSSNYANIQSKVSGANAAVLGILPLNDQFSVFGKVGAIIANVDNSVSSNFYGNVSHKETKTKPMWGLGGNWNVTPQIALRAEFEQYRLNSDELKNVNVATVGVAYKF